MADPYNEDDDDEAQRRQGAGRFFTGAEFVRAVEERIATHGPIFSDAAIADLVDFDRLLPAPKGAT